MVSAPEADTRDGRHAAMSSDFPSKLPSAKQLIAAATSPGDRDLSDVAISRRSDVGPSPKLHIEAREAYPPASYRRDHVVPISSPPVNGHHHHSNNNGMHRQPSLPTGSAHSQAEAEAMQRTQGYADYSRQMDSQTREINNLGELLMRIEHKVQSLDRDMHIVRQELHHRVSAPQAGNVDDGTLEIFSRNLSQVANKANEVDGIAVELALLRRKVARLEEERQLASPATINGQFPHRDASLHAPPAPASAVHQQHTLPTIPSISTLASPHHPPERRVVQTPGGPLVVEYPDPRAAEHRGSGHSITHAHDVETPSSAIGGWTSVNQGAKRPSDANGRVDMSGTPLGSPKRPKLAPLEPRVPSSESVPHTSSLEEHRELPHLRPHSTESYPDTAQSHPHHPGYPPMHDATPDDNWRHESQRPLHGGHSAGGSPKRGGRGGRGRGGRRSGHEQELMTTPEWERENWAAAGTQAGPDGYYHPITPSGRGRGVIRRGSSGGHPPPGSQHLAAQTVMMQPGDPYAHTKKQRQKPTRNADGILIRKDGRPDMRSQSSAANLRKVHARKEEERQREWEAAHATHSPTSGKGGFTAMNTSARESRSASSESQDVAEAQLQGDKTEEQTRHEQIMKQMFPRGVEESRSRAIYGFGDDQERRGPAGLSREHSRDSMRVDDTQPSTAAVSKVPTPEPPVEATEPIIAEDNNEKDAPMEDAAPITAPVQVETAAAAAAAEASEAVEKE